MDPNNEAPVTEAAETPAPADTTSAADEFAAAFAQFASPGEKPAETVSASEPEAQQPPPVDATEEVETAPDEGEQTAANVDASQSTAAATSAAPTTEPPRFTADEWARFMAAQQQAQYAQQPPQPAPAPQRSEPPPVLSKEEVETIQEFRKEWPDVAKALDIQQKAFADNLLSYVFNQFAEVITPVVQQVESVAERSHIGDIYDFVPDYDQVREPVINWVASLPNSAFRQYAVSVVNDGAPNDIQQLVDQWRMFNGVPAPQAQAPAPSGVQQRAFNPAYIPGNQAPRVQRKAVDPAIARAAAAMAPVKSQRTTVVQTDDPNDFDGAFERAAALAKQERDAFANRRH